MRMRGAEGIASQLWKVISKYLVFKVFCLNHALSYSIFSYILQHQTYKSFFRIWICSRTALLLVPPVAFFSSTARS
jgi:hypothetical protein